jgi:hypothetical protein
MIATVAAWTARHAAVAAAVVAIIAAPRSEGQPRPAGSTAAVLSFIDAAAGRVEVVRHWPAAPVDVDVYPFVPYPWTACPGPGALMMLVAGPGVGPPVADRIAGALRLAGAVRPAAPGAQELLRIAAGLLTPGDPVEEALKSAAPWISDLGTYERLGYAVFLFIHWQGVRCGVTLTTVPEGYAIPFVD